MLALYEIGNEAAWLASFRFSVEVRPRYCECDAQGHVSNVIYPEYLEFSRLQYFKTAGDPESGDFAFQHVTAELQLRYLAACYYDEPLRLASKLTTLGRSSATMDQAVSGADGTVRAISRVTVVRSSAAGTAPWSTAQRAALESFEGRSFSAQPTA